MLSATEHTLPEEECDVICYSPPQGSITHAGPLAQGGQHLGSEEQKPGDAAGCVTLPRSGYTSVRRHCWLLVCVPSLRAGASLRWELPGDPLVPIPCSHYCQTAKLSTCRTITVLHWKTPTAPSSPRPHPGLLPPETRPAQQMGAKCIEAPTLGMPRGLKKTAAPEAFPGRRPASHLKTHSVPRGASCVRDAQRVATPTPSWVKTGFDAVKKQTHVDLTPVQMHFPFVDY